MIFFRRWTEYWYMYNLLKTIRQPTKLPITKMEMKHEYLSYTNNTNEIVLQTEIITGFYSSFSKWWDRSVDWSRISFYSSFSKWWDRSIDPEFRISYNYIIWHHVYMIEKEMIEKYPNPENKHSEMIPIEKHHDS